MQRCGLHTGELLQCTEAAPQPRQRRTRCSRHLQRHQNFVADTKCFVAGTSCPRRTLCHVLQDTQLLQTQLLDAEPNTDRHTSAKLRGVFLVHLLGVAHC